MLMWPRMKLICGTLEGILKIYGVFLCYKGMKKCMDKSYIKCRMSKIYWKQKLKTKTLLLISQSKKFNKILI